MPKSEYEAKKKEKALHLPKCSDLQLMANNMVSPLTLAEAPDDSHRLFVLDQVGKVWIIDANGNKMPQPFIDISSKMVGLTPSYDERGLKMI